MKMWDLVLLAQLGYLYFTSALSFVQCLLLLLPSILRYISPTPSKHACISPEDQEDEFRKQLALVSKAETIDVQTCSKIRLELLAKKPKRNRHLNLLGGGKTDYPLEELIHPGVRFLHVEYWEGVNLKGRLLRLDSISFAGFPRDSIKGLLKDIETSKASKIYFSFCDLNHALILEITKKPHTSFRFNQCGAVEKTVAATRHLDVRIMEPDLEPSLRRSGGT